ncbi:MAG TPA: TlyA family RNA methyltransferase [Actinomycetota bacterium]|nr:TlyA family RNA methyltransferase [Actinomycetota bacterium]
MSRRRLDAELVRRGLARSRTEAQAAVRAGLVVVGGRPADKASRLVGPDEPLALAAPARRFVSRGGVKLEAALERFEIDVAGRDCLDVGASTGGFTDCLLGRQARRVVAVDVGYGQLDWSLRNDPRVTVLERTNARRLSAADLPFAPEVVVADLSFISLRLVVPTLTHLALPGADLVLLVKPQFEADPREVGRGGVVREPGVWRRVIESVVEACIAAGAAPRAVMPSPIKGPAGNVEFLLHAVKGGTRADLDVDAVVEEARGAGGRA